ncbi:hypothetical protein Ancab_002724 [Ancistrocladus abbreviatus]
MAAWDSDDWELINDDGFVYKRKKRRLNDPSSLARPPDPAPDPEAEEKCRRERKRRALLKLREKYEKEIALWEHLSNNLCAAERSAKEKKEQQLQGRQNSEKQEGKQLQCEEQEASSSSLVPAEGNSSGSLIDKLLLQVEAQEAMIRHVTNLCDVVEALCEAQDQKVKDSFIHLPIWGSPRELMASLCDD